MKITIEAEIPHGMEEEFLTFLARFSVNCPECKIEIYGVTESTTDEVTEVMNRIFGPGNIAKGYLN